MADDEQPDPRAEERVRLKAHARVVTRGRVGKCSACATVDIIRDVEVVGRTPTGLCAFHNAAERELRKELRRMKESGVEITKRAKSDAYLRVAERMKGPNQ